MQRVRIGLTGLAFVFVLVLLAAVFSRATDEEPITADRIEEVAIDPSSTGGNDAVPAEEPLAELGVAPGGPPELQNEVTNETVAVEDPLRVQRRR